MALPTSSKARDFNLHRYCILWFTAVLYLSRTASIAVADQISNTRAWSGLNSELTNEIPEAGNSGLDRAELWKPVSLGDGVSDVMATVGKVFKFTVPENAFLGDNLKYKVCMQFSESYNFNTYVLSSKINFSSYFVSGAGLKIFKDLSWLPRKEQSTCTKFAFNPFLLKKCKLTLTHKIPTSLDKFPSWRAYNCYHGYQCHTDPHHVITIFILYQPYHAIQTQFLFYKWIMLQHCCETSLLFYNKLDQVV